MMKDRFSKSIFHILLLFSILIALFGSQPATAAQAAGNSGLPVEQLLNPDGSLDLDTGYRGNLDIDNYDITLDPLRGPLLRPLAAPSIWNALGAGLNNMVLVIAISGSDVYVGGYFTDAGGNPNADYIAKWDGTAWSALGTTPFNNTVNAIVINGADVYAGGAFLDAGGDANADNIAKWDGTAWSALAGGLNSWVAAIAISGADVYVGGQFTDAGGDANADKIAKWDGAAWSALGTTPLNDSVFAIAISGTDVYAGGFFTDAGGDANADYIAKWDGATWSALGTMPLSTYVYAIAISGTDVYVGGDFTDVGGDTNADSIAKWDGAAWSALGGGLNSRLRAIAISGADVYVSGDFSDAGGDANADYTAKWDGATWSALGTPLNDFVTAIAVSGVDVYAGGNFSDAGGDANADKIARFGLENIPPTVVSSVRANTSPTNLSSVSFTVTFSESVTGVDTGDFSLTTTGVTGASVTGVSGSGSTRTVTVNTGSGNGAIRLNVIDNDTIMDLASNKLGGTGLGNGNFMTGQAYTVNKERARNGGFNTYIGASKIPQYWVKSATFATTDGKTTTVKKEGIASVKIAGEPGKTKTLTQALMLSGVTGSTFTFSFWARGISIPAAGLCQAQVMLYNGATLKLTRTILCNTGTYTTFQKKTLTFNATSAYTKVIIKFIYSKASGAVWFDAVSLIK
jgi:hypothetical protein